METNLKEDVISPQYSFRVEPSQMLKTYGSAEAAFNAGAFLIAAEYAESQSELEGCALVLSGAPSRGLSILKEIPSLTERGNLCTLLAVWQLSGDIAAINKLSQIQFSELSPAIKCFRDLLLKPEIRIFVTGMFWSTNRVGIVDGQCFGRFSIRTCGAQRMDHIRYTHDYPLDTFIEGLPEGVRPDLLYCMNPSWVTPRNLANVTIPKVLWCHDVDEFLYRNALNMSLYDVRICLTTTEHFEMQKAIDGISVSNFLSDPLISNFPKQRTSNKKEYDVVFTGGLGGDTHPEKSRFIYLMGQLTENYKIKVIDGYMKGDEYLDFLSKGKFMPIVSRLAGNPSPRWRDALMSGTCVLYPDGTAYGKAFPGCFPIRTTTIVSDLETHLTNFDGDAVDYRHADVSKKIECEVKEFQLTREAFTELQLKYVAFCGMVLPSLLPKSKKRKNTNGKHPRLLSQPTWLTPQVDCSIYGRECTINALHNYVLPLLDLENQDIIFSNNLAYALASIAIQDPDISKITHNRAVATIQYQTNAERFTDNLICQFNYAFWIFLENARYDKNATDDFADQFGDTEKAKKLFNKLIENWDALEFEPENMTVALPFLLVHEQIFPHTDYSQIISRYLAEDKPKKLKLTLNKLLKSSAYTALARIAREQDQIPLSLRYITKSLQEFPGNIQALRWELDALLAMSSGIRNTDLSLPNLSGNNTCHLSQKITTSFFNLVNIQPAALTQYTSEVCEHFIATSQLVELKQVLNGWYRMSNIIHHMDENKLRQTNESDWINIQSFAEYLPSELLKKRNTQQNQLTQFEKLFWMSSNSKARPLSRIKKSIEGNYKKITGTTSLIFKIKVKNFLFKHKLADDFWDAFYWSRNHKTLKSIPKASIFQKLVFIAVKLIKR